MAKLLEQDEMKSYSLWRESEASIASVIGDDYMAALGRQIENFDFADALSTLQVIWEAYPHLKSY